MDFQGFADNPSAVLERLYNKVYQEQMKGLPICNENIEVEAVNFQLWQDQWLGILVTPWFTNLLILRQKGQAWPELKLGKGNELEINFPAGTIKFTPRFEPELGSYLCCSLVSPMTDVKSHQQAISDAKQALRQLTEEPIAIQIVDAANDEDNTELTEQQLARRNFMFGKR